MLLCSAMEVFSSLLFNIGPMLRNCIIFFATKFPMIGALIQVIWIIDLMASAVGG